MKCEHRDTEGYEYTRHVGPRCHREAAYYYEQRGVEVHVCRQHAEDVRDLELHEVGS